MCSSDLNGTANTQTLTLEQIFLSIVGNEPGAQQHEQELSWLG